MLLKRDLFLLYLGFVARYSGSFLSLPFLARVLGPAGLGELVIAISLAALIGLCVEFGFGVSALRDVAGCQSTAERRVILDGVLCAKLGLFILSAASFCGIVLIVPNPLPLRTILLICLLGGLQGLSLSWYLQGTQRGAMAAGIEVMVQLAWILAAIAFVRAPQDVSWILGFQIGAHAGGLAIAFRLCRPDWNRLAVDWPRVVAQLKTGLPLFVMRASSAAFTTASVLLLAGLSTVTEAGYYNAAERVAGTLIAAFTPASQAILPYLVRHHAACGEKAMLKSARRILALLFVIGCGSMLALLVGAPYVIRILTGTEYGPSVYVLQCLSFAFPFVALSQALGLYVMIPMRLDAWVSAGIVLAAGCSLLASTVLVTDYGAVGMAICRVMSEAIIALSFAAVLAYRGVLPDLLRLSRKTS